jgi:hypothetical protein
VCLWVPQGQLLNPPHPQSASVRRFFPFPRNLSLRRALCRRRFPRPMMGGVKYVWGADYDPNAGPDIQP